MNAFKLTNRHRTDETEDTVVRDFQRRAPFWSYRVTEYRPFAPFAEFRKELDGYLEKLFAGEIDDGNGDVLDNLIVDIARQAQFDLEKQRADHQDNLRNLQLRTVGDRSQFLEARKTLAVDLDDNLIEQEALKKRLRNQTFREEKHHEHS